MPRVTKAMLESRILGLDIANSRLRQEVEQLKEVNQLLLRKDFDVGEFCKMHNETITAIAHTVTNLRVIIQSRL